MRVATTWIENSRIIPITLWLEPWGEDYTLQPGEVVELRGQQAITDLHWRLTYSEQMITICIEGPSDARPEIYLKGQLLPCGYNREIALHSTDLSENQAKE